MSENNEKPVSIRRIVVAVDASPHSHAALEAAVQLAARFDAELEGLFVEDLNVLRAAQLPFAYELGRYSAGRRRISVREMERRLRIRSRQMRRAFTALIEREAVRGVFHSARGMVQAEIHAAAERSDVLIVGRVGWSQLRERELGSTARAVCLDEVPSVTVVLHESARLTPPIVVVYDGTSIADKALATAMVLVDEMSGPLHILLLAEGEEDVPQLKERANECLRTAAVMHQFHALTAPNVHSLTQAIHERDTGTLVLPARIASLPQELLPDLVESVDIPVLLVR